jgi:CubicO group peptidase (beta-lactamase class C family)
MFGKIFFLLTNNIIFNKILISLKLDAMFIARFGIYKRMQLDPTLSPQEMAGFSKKEEVQEAIDKKAIPGCQILVAKNNKIIFNKAYGYTAGEGSAPVSLDTYYDLASVTKITATTVSIMKLVEQGKVDINKTIGDYLPWVLGNEKASITLKDLLLHQAGLYPYIKFYEALLSPTGEYLDGLITKIPDNSHHKMITPTKYLLDNWEDSIKNV